MPRASGGDDRPTAHTSNLAPADAPIADANLHPHLHHPLSARILYPMAQEPDRLNPDERAREKQRSRAEDARALASGEKSRDELRRENGHFAFRNVRVSLRGSKPLE